MNHKFILLFCLHEQFSKRSNLFRIAHGAYHTVHRLRRNQRNAAISKSLSCFIYGMPIHFCVKMRRGRKERAFPSFPPLLAQNHLLSALLSPLFPACSGSSLGHGLGQTDDSRKRVYCVYRGWEYAAFGRGRNK